MKTIELIAGRFFQNSFLGSELGWAGFEKRIDPLGIKKGHKEFDATNQGPSR
jgi:hypothetical protein